MIPYTTTDISLKSRCSAISKSGERCSRKAAQNPSHLCTQHFKLKTDPSIVKTATGIQYSIPIKTNYINEDCGGFTIFNKQCQNKASYKCDIKCKCSGQTFCKKHWLSFHEIEQEKTHKHPSNDERCEILYKNAAKGRCIDKSIGFDESGKMVCGRHYPILLFKKNNQEDNNDSSDSNNSNNDDNNNNNNNSNNSNNNSNNSNNNNNNTSNNNDIDLILKHNIKSLLSFQEFKAPPFVQLWDLRVKIELLSYSSNDKRLKDSLIWLDKYINYHFIEDNKIIVPSLQVLVLHFSILVENKTIRILQNLLDKFGIDNLRWLLYNFNLVVKKSNDYDLWVSWNMMAEEYELDKIEENNLFGSILMM